MSEEKSRYQACFEPPGFPRIFKSSDDLGEVKLWIVAQLGFCNAPVFMEIYDVKEHHFILLEEFPE